MMHLGAINRQAAFAGQRVVRGQLNHAGPGEDPYQQQKDAFAQQVKIPDILIEESMGIQEVSLAHGPARQDQVRYVSMAA